jgi:hypothetical protein
LAAYAGQTLTQEVALALVRQMFPDRTRQPDTFAPKQYKDYRFQVELLRDICDEIHPLHEAHYAETEHYRAGIALNMDYRALKEREYAGGLLQFTARDNAGQLVGHMRVYLSPSMHTQTLVATEDAFYVKPEHRGGFMAVRLWQYADACGEQIGVAETYFDSKLCNKADSMARYLKYTPVATRFCKINIPKE